MIHVQKYEVKIDFFLQKTVYAKEADKNVSNNSFITVSLRHILAVAFCYQYLYNLIDFFLPKPTIMEPNIYIF